MTEWLSLAEEIDSLRVGKLRHYNDPNMQCWEAALTVGVSRVTLQFQDLLFLGNSPERRMEARMRWQR